jgi:hypothetical protein
VGPCGNFFHAILLETRIFNVILKVLKNVSNLVQSIINFRRPTGLPGYVHTWTASSIKLELYVLDVIWYVDSLSNYRHLST